MNQKGHKGPVLSILGRHKSNMVSHRLPPQKERHKSFNSLPPDTLQTAPPLLLQASPSPAPGAPRARTAPVQRPPRTRPPRGARTAWAARGRAPPSRGAAPPRQKRLNGRTRPDAPVLHTWVDLQKGREPALHQGMLDLPIIRLNCMVTASGTPFTASDFQALPQTNQKPRCTKAP